ncbi:hypothetical protein E2C01_068147 [Portunus trituberculatus]|uniref:Uncharacterized protein n=1 Tax=Portunus trituberculatus TaxID=210409 RepID=A0A5B7HVT2_PORTR|nr:hypothetical protein [Portunus trituberculatus]
MRRQQGARQGEGCGHSNSVSGVVRLSMGTDRDCCPIQGEIDLEYTPHPPPSLSPTLRVFSPLHSSPLHSLLFSPRLSFGRPPFTLFSLASLSLCHSLY